MLDNRSFIFIQPILNLKSKLQFTTLKKSSGGEQFKISCFGSPPFIMLSYGEMFNIYLFYCVHEWYILLIKLLLIILYVLFNSYILLRHPSGVAGIIYNISKKFLKT